MKPNAKELKAIRISKRYYINKNKGLMKFFSYIKFRFKRYDVSKKKTMAQLWHQYGLHSTGVLINEGIKFSDEEKMDCISKWFDIFYSDEFDVITDYNNKWEEHQKHMKEYYKTNTSTDEIHINWDFPTLEKYIQEMDAVFGNYDN